MKHAEFDYEEVLASSRAHAANTHPFADWDRRFGDLPSRALALLDSALLYTYCQMPDEVVRTFLEGAIGVAERVIREGRFAQAPDEEHPYLLASGRQNAHRAHALGCALRDGKWPDAQEIRAVIENQVAASRELGGKGNWDVLQSTYLCAVELELINGEPARAYEMLRKRYSFKRSRPRHEAMLHFCEDVLGAKSAQARSQPFAGFEAFFDLRRMPRDRRAIYAFEPESIVYDDRQVQVLQMALIRHRYVDGKGASPDWPRILDLVTRPTQHSVTH